MRANLALILCVAIAACSVTPPLNNYKPIRKDTSFPRLGTEIEVKSGEDMLRHGQITETRGLRLYGVAKPGGYVVTAGFYPRIGADREFTYHSYRRKRSNDGDGNIPPARDILGNWAAPPDAIRVARARPELCLIFAQKGKKFCTDEISHRLVKRYHLTDRDLNQKLIFEGRSGNTIKVRYWEDSGHFARPESSRILKFPAKTPRVIQYKGARIRVLEANAESIRFIVLETFPSYWTQTSAKPQN